MSERFQKIFFPSSILILVLILFSEALLGRTTWIIQTFIFETFAQWFPFKEFIALCYKNGFFPLWTHNIECGFPLASFPHSGPFYLLNILFIFLDYARGITLFSLFQELILCYSSYLCARELKFSRLASWIFSLSFGLSGAGYLFAGSFPLHGTLSWLPVVFFFSMRLSRKPRLANLLGLLFSSSIQVTAGDFEQILYQDIIILIFLLFIRRVSLKNTFFWTLIILASFLAASVQVLPFINLLHNSYRQTLVVSPSIQLPNFYLLVPLGWLAPFCSPFQDKLLPSPLYLGFMFLLGLFLAWKNPSSRRELKILLLFGALALFYLINPWPICDIGFLHFIPPDARFKVLGPFQFWMLIVAGSGINQLCQWPWSKAQMRLVKNFILAFGLFTALLISASFLIPESFLLKNKIPDLSSLLLVPFRAVFAGLAILFAVFIGIISRKENIRNSLLLSLFSLLFLSDIFLSAWALRPHQSPQPFLEKPPGLEFLQKQNPTHRIHYVSYLLRDRELWRYHNLYNGPGHIHSCIRVGLRHTTPLLFKISGGDFNLMRIKYLNAETKPILDMLGVRYVVARAPFFWGMNPRPLNPFSAVSTQPSIAPGDRTGFETEFFPGDVLRLRTLPASDHLKIYLSLNGREQELQIPTESKPIKLDVPSLQYGEVIFENPVSVGFSKPLVIPKAYLSNPSRPYQLVYKDEFEIYENRTAWPRYFLADEDIMRPDSLGDHLEILKIPSCGDGA